MYFRYGDNEVAYLRSRDARLGAVIEKIGHIDREVDSNLFASVVHHIVGQQISTKAQTTIWQRMNERLGPVTAKTVTGVTEAELQEAGISFRKAAYIKDFAEK